MADTIEGGRYLVGGVLVNANGDEITGASEAEQEGGGGEQYPYADLLAQNGYESWDAVQNAEDDDLLAIDGIGPKRLAEIRAHKG